MAVVYLHKRKSDGMVFYVGIGKKEKRAYDVSKRSNLWKQYTANNEYFIEILTKDISWEDACLIEIELISFYGRADLKFGHLINLTNGGDGTIGRIVSEYERRNISKRMVGNKYSLGTKVSEKHKNNLSKYRSIPVIKCTILGEVIEEYESAKLAAENNNCHRSHITAVCKGKRTLSGGYKWKYKNE